MIQFVKPLRDNVLLERLDAHEKVGSLFIPDNAKKKNEYAKVISLGEGRETRYNVQVPFEVKVGEIVYIPKDEGANFKIAGKEYILVAERKLLLHGEDNDCTPETKC